MKKEKHNYLLIIFIVLTANIVGYSQADRNLHQESLDDAYISVLRENMEKGPSYNVRNSRFFTSQVNVDINGNDIIGDAANEPSIAVDPTNPNRIVIGWRQFDTINSNFRQAGYGYSLDGGLTWTFPGVLEPGIFRSDPVLDFDADGNFYYNSLRSGFFCDVYKIDDGGVVWNPFVPAKGGDKQWMRIDKTNGIGAGNNYSFWNLSFTTCSPGSFTRSTDGSQTFENCLIIDNDPYWGTLAVDADGTLYMVGESNIGLVVVKSTTAKDPNSAVTWDSANSVSLDGFLGVGGAVNPQGLLGQAWIDVDISGGAGHGNVYVLASVERSSNSDLGDVMFAKSTDGGGTFSAPIRINTDTGTDNVQWFGTMAVAPNGRIDVVWLDTRDAPTGTNNSVLYYSFSTDQGETWSPNEELSISFNPNIGYPQQNKMGDYYDMVSDNNGVHLAWANTINGGQDVYYTHITPNDTFGLDDIASEISKAICYPNPFKDTTTISFSVKNNENITVDVFDMLGKKQARLLDKKITGTHNLTWDGRNAHKQRLSAGLYFVSIKSKKNTKIIKVLLR